MVTGGSGLVGKAIQEVIAAENNSEEKWVYLSSKDGNCASPPRWQPSSTSTSRRMSSTSLLRLAASSRT